MIRHGAIPLHAFAEAGVPRFTVVLRKAFGGAYSTMNSKDLGADLYLAWTRAELGTSAPIRPWASFTGGRWRSPPTRPRSAAGWPRRTPSST